MCIAYMTTDDVNQNLAALVGPECGASLVNWPGRDLPSGDGIEAVIYDLDHLDPQHREVVMKELLSRPSPTPAAVHSYNLTDQQMATLHANGVIVSRHFDPDVLRRLCQVASSPRLSPPDGDGPDPEGVQADPALLCASVRSLASHAHGALKGAAGCSGDGARGEPDRLIGEIAHLQRQIDRLRQSHGLRLDELQRWLDRLRELVEVRRHP
jgi:hypothetical protein